MKQLIARIDDELHERLKTRAATEHRSMNALVVEALEAVAGAETAHAGVRRRAARANRLITPPQPKRVPSYVAVERATRGAGTVASEALTAERAAR